MATSAWASASSARDLLYASTPLGYSWVNTARALNPGTGSSTSASDGPVNQSTHWLVVDGFNFSDVPVGSTITGVEVEITLSLTDDTTTTAVARLTQSGTPVGNEWRSNTLDLSPTYTLGNNTNWYGLTLTQVDLSTLGVAIRAETTGTNEVAETYGMDYIRVRVYYTAPAGETVPPFTPSVRLAGDIPAKAGSNVANYWDNPEIDCAAHTKIVNGNTSPATLSSDLVDVFQKKGYVRGVHIGRVPGYAGSVYLENLMTNTDGGRRLIGHPKDRFAYGSVSESFRHITLWCDNGIEAVKPRVDAIMKDFKEKLDANGLCYPHVFITNPLPSFHDVAAGCINQDAPPTQDGFWPFAVNDPRFNTSPAMYRVTKGSRRELTWGQASTMYRRPAYNADDVNQIGYSQNTRRFAAWLCARVMEVYSRAHYLAFDSVVRKYFPMARVLCRGMFASSSADIPKAAGFVEAQNSDFFDVRAFPVSVVQDFSHADLQAAPLVTMLADEINPDVHARRFLPDNVYGVVHNVLGIDTSVTLPKIGVAYSVDSELTTYTWSSANFKELMRRYIGMGVRDFVVETDGVTDWDTLFSALNTVITEAQVGSVLQTTPNALSFSAVDLPFDVTA